MIASSLLVVLTTITGIVILPDGSPAPGATVIVQSAGTENRIVAFADHEGLYSIDVLSDPPWEIRAEYSGFVPAVKTLTGPPDGTVQLRLNPPAFAALTEVLAAAPAGPRQKVERSQLATRGNVLEALESTTPIGRIGAGGTGDTPSIRGLARRRVATYVDGARLPGFRRVGTSLEAIDPLMLEEAAVESGGRSAMTGSEAIGGTLEVRTLEPRDRPLFTAQYNSGSRESAALVAYPVELDPSTHLQFAAGYRKADDIRTPLGTMRPSSYERANFVFSATGRTRNGTWSGRALIARLDDVGRPRWQREDRPTFVPDASLGRLGYSWWGTPPSWLRGDSLEITATAGHRKETTARFRYGIENQRSRASALDFQSHAATTWTFGAHHISAALDFSGTLDQDWKVRDSLGVSRPLSDGRSLSAAAVFSDRIVLGHGWELEAAARGDAISDRATVQSGHESRSFQALTGRLDVVRRFGSGSSLRASLSRSFRAPSLDERYYTGPTGRGWINGNPNLDPETGLTVEASAVWQPSFGTTQLTVYNTSLEDPIERIEPEEDIYTWTNSEDAGVYGIEGSISADLSQSWKLSAIAGWARGRTDDDLPLADIPSTRFVLTLERQGARSTYGGRVITTASKTDPGPSEVRRDSWNRVDIWASFELWSNVSVRVEVTNLLDREIWPSADRLAIPAVERSAGLTLTWTPEAATSGGG